jgi:putative nucleotidyltransferase with HDIG domain
MRRAWHLTARFLTSLRPRAVDGPERAAVQRALTPSELAVWETLGRADRAESVAVARRAARALGPDADARWLAAALLHDAGKTRAGLGTPARVVATIVAGAAGHRRARRWTGRIGRYIAHDDEGAEMLTAAGARPEVAAWAGAHHRRDRWSATGIPAEICEILAAADGDR